MKKISRIVQIDGKPVLLQLFGPRGPHAGQWKIFYKKQWHHYRWASKREVNRHGLQTCK